MVLLGILTIVLPRPGPAAVPGGFYEMTADGASSSPSQRNLHASAFDAAQGLTVVFGGERSDGTTAGDTWTWDGSAWSEVASASSPSARFGAAMAYDAGRGRIVLFGGTSSGGNFFGDTWEFDGSAWAVKTPSSSPLARYTHHLAYDPAAGKVLLFGGIAKVRQPSPPFLESPATVSDTWSWDGTDWVELSPGSSPGARASGAMALDESRGRIVLHGGSTWETSDVFSDTWEWNGSTWLEAGPSTDPGPRHWHAMAYDGLRECVVLYGGASTVAPYGTEHNDCWDWDGNDWSQRSLNYNGPAKVGHSLAWDSWHGRVVLFGGGASTDIQVVKYNDTRGLGPSGAALWSSVVMPAFTAVHRGQASIPVSVRFANPGNVSANLSGASLRFESSGGVDRSSEYTTGSPSSLPASLAASGSALVEFQAAVSLSATTGPVFIHGTLSGTDASTEASLSTTVSRSPGNWTVTPFSLRWLERQASGSPEAPAVRGRPAMAFDAATGKTLLFGGRDGGGPFTYFDETWSWDGTSWQQLATATAPRGRCFAQMVHEPDQGRVVLFGGTSGGGDLADTWQLQGTTWTELTTGTAPSARSAYGMAHDTRRRRTILHGGGSALSDTWAFQGTVWTELSPATSPDRKEHSLAYDPVRDRVVLFGGRTGTGQTPADTWEFDGTNWEQRAATTAPKGRYGASLAYDASLGGVVLFGGAVPTASDETWLWDGTDWRRMTASSAPPGRQGHMLAYDSWRGHLVMFGHGSGLYNDTWELAPRLGTLCLAHVDAVRTQVVLGKSAGIASATVFNAGAEAVALTTAGLAFSGATGSDVTTHFTFTPREGNPGSLAADSSASLSFNVAVASDAATGTVTLDGWAAGADATEGTNSSVAGAARTTNWTVLPQTQWLHVETNAGPPSDGDTPSMLAFHAGIDRTVFFGLNSNSAVLSGETWEFDGSAWTEKTLATAPAGRERHAMAYDAARRELVLFGGLSQGNPVGDTWVYDGTAWTQRFPATSPSARASQAMAYDSHRRRVVLFGAPPASADGETWEWDGSGWSRRSPAQAPAGRRDASLAYDPYRRVVLLFGGRELDNTLPPETWAWDGTEWAQRTPATSPPPRASAGMAYDSVRQRIVLQGGENGVSTFTDTWEWIGQNWEQLAPAGFLPSDDQPLLSYDTSRGRLFRFSREVISDAWQFAPTQASISVARVTPSTAAIVAGRLGVPIEVRVVNGGLAPCSVSSVFLTVRPLDDGPAFGFSGGPPAGLPRSLAAGEATTFSCLLNVFDFARTVPHAIEGNCLAYEDGTGAATSADRSDSPGRVRVLAPASLGVGPLRTPPSVSAPRSFLATVAVSNVGESPANVTSAALSFSGSDVTATPRVGNPATVPASASRDFVFDVTVAGTAALGLRSASLTLLATDANTGRSANRTAALSGGLQLVAAAAPASLSITSVSADAGRISRGQGGLAVTMSVSNTGGTTAEVELLRTGLRFNGSRAGYAVTTSGPSTIAPSATAVYQFTLAASGSAPLGEIILDGVIVAIDSISRQPAGDTGAAVTDSWEVQRPAALAFGSLEAPANVSRGASFVATVSIANTGEAPAAQVSGSLEPGVEGVTASARAGNPDFLAGGVTATFRFDVAIATSVSTGPVGALLSILGRDENSNASAGLTRILTQVFSIPALPAPTGTPGTPPTTGTTEPPEPPSLSLTLASGPTLISLPFQPLATDATPLDSAALRRVTGARTIVRLNGEPGRFLAEFEGVPSEPFELEGSHAYLLFRTAGEQTVLFTGRAWPESASIRRVSPPLALVGYPAPRGSPGTLEDLRQLAGASWVVRTAPDRDGRGRFLLYLPGLTPAVPLEPGAGYLLGGHPGGLVEFK